MPAIQPNSTIRLYTGIPLDSGYSDTLWFSTLSDQTSFFMQNTYLKRQFSQQTYQRVNEGVFEASCSADEIYDVNYMAFQNSSYGNKWFYAFVTKVEYRNNSNAYVYFVIDVLQTYLFDIQREQCFIERQHTISDDLYEHLLPENLEIGEYMYDNYQKISAPLLNNYVIIIMVSDVSTNVDGKIYDRVYSGAKLWVFPLTSGAITNINALLDNYRERPESILTIYMTTAFNIGATAYNQLTDSGLELATNIHDGESGSISIGNYAPHQVSDFDGYTPTNKKVLSYPYNYLHVDNNSGSALALRFEFFSSQNPNLYVEGNVLPPVQIKLSPKNYKFQDTNLAPSLGTEYLTLTSFPLCSWSYDSFRAWLAQNSIPVAIGVGGSVLAGLATIATGGALAPVAIGVIGGTVASIGKQATEASIKADPCRGDVQNGNLNYAVGRQAFYVARARITREYAIMIDKFFTMYGYKINNVALPNLHARPHFTYIKTIGFKCHGACPNDAIIKWQQIFDTGVTWWVDASEVGNYSVDNKPVSNT